MNLNPQSAHMTHTYPPAPFSQFKSRRNTIVNVSFDLEYSRITIFIYSIISAAQRTAIFEFFLPLFVVYSYSVKTNNWNYNCTDCECNWMRFPSTNRLLWLQRTMFSAAKGPNSLGDRPFITESNIFGLFFFSFFFFILGYFYIRCFIIYLCLCKTY